MYNIIALLASPVFTAGAPTTGLLVFDPPTLSVNDALFNTQFKVKLLTVPNHPLQVSFEGPGFTFSNCSIILHDDQWQTMSVSGIPVFHSRVASTVAVKVRVFADEGNVDQSYKAIRTIVPGGTCSSSADPHIITFNNIAISPTDIGCYKLFDHKDLSIQTTQTVCGVNGTAACNQAVAIRYGSSIVALDVRTSASLKQITPNTDKMIITEPSVNDATYTLALPCGSIIKMIVNQYGGYKWIDVTLSVVSGYGSNGGICNKLNEQSGKLVSATGSLIEVVDFASFSKSWIVADADNLLNGRYISSTPAVIVGNICKIPKKLISTTTITTTTTNAPILLAYTPFVSSIVPTTTIQTTTIVFTTVLIQTTVLPVAVTSTTVVLQTTLSPATATLTHITSSIIPTTTIIDNKIISTSIVIPITPVITSIRPETTVIAQTFTTTSISLKTTTIPVTISTTSLLLQTSILGSSSTAVYSMPTPPPDFINQATSYCKSLFDSNCKSLIDQQHYIDACISDAMMVGSLVFCESHKLSYNIRCKTETDYMINDYQNTTVIIAQDIQKSAGLGAHECSNNCSSNGVCGANGCRCNSGFGGLDCSNNLSTMISYNQITGSYGTSGVANDAVVVIPSQSPQANPTLASVAVSIVNHAVSTSTDEPTNPIISGTYTLGYSFAVMLMPLLAQL